MFFEISGVLVDQGQHIRQHTDHAAISSSGDIINVIEASGTLLSSRHIACNKRC